MDEEVVFPTSQREMRINCLIEEDDDIEKMLSGIPNAVPTRWPGIGL